MYTKRKTCESEFIGEIIMPLVQLNLRKGRTREEKYAVADAVHAALVTAFRIPEHDWNIRIIEYTRENYLLPRGRSVHFILVDFTAFAGRSANAKLLLYRTMVDNLKTPGTYPMDIIIIILDVILENCGLRGGIMASYLELGFDISV
jgi:phenylpyruvate tautomerase PptA (4-oxalocrotonate tautomerase family)